MKFNHHACLKSTYSSGERLVGNADLRSLQKSLLHSFAPVTLNPCLIKDTLYNPEIFQVFLAPAGRHVYRKPNRHILKPQRGDRCGVKLVPAGNLSRTETRPAHLGSHTYLRFAQPTEHRIRVRREPTLAFGLSTVRASDVLRHWQPTVRSQLCCR